MRIEVLGVGCANCERQYTEAEKAIAQSGVEAELVNVEKLDDLLRYGIMLTPAIVIDGEVKCSGKVATAAEIAGWLK